MRFNRPRNVYIENRDYIIEFHDVRGVKCLHGIDFRDEKLSVQGSLQSSFLDNFYGHVNLSLFVPALVNFTAVAFPDLVR